MFFPFSLLTALPNHLFFPPIMLFCSHITAPYTGPGNPRSPPVSHTTKTGSKGKKNVDQSSPVRFGFVRIPLAGLLGTEEIEFACVLIIRFFGIVSPPHDSNQHTAIICMRFLIGTESLDVIVTCELEADKDTLASVVSRQHTMPLYMRQQGIRILSQP